MVITNNILVFLWVCISSAKLRPDCCNCEIQSESEKHLWKGLIILVYSFSVSPCMFDYAPQHLTPFIGQMEPGLMEREERDQTRVRRCLFSTRWLSVLWLCCWSLFVYFIVELRSNHCCINSSWMSCSCCWILPVDSVVELCWLMCFPS